ncbi:hypothetical protein C8J57DRAFT_1588878 [Mycena rebaudengoi]|nr:hypothetical protein C8J57DRAFT_1588878 [Mycena rebaudengoi]
MVEKEKDGWFKNVVNRACIGYDYWPNGAPFKLTLNLHSSVFGHTVQDPMMDLATLMGMLLDAQGGTIKPSDNKAIRTRLPSLSLHGIDVALSGPGAKVCDAGLFPSPSASVYPTHPVSSALPCFLFPSSTPLAPVLPHTILPRSFTSTSSPSPTFHSLSPILPRSPRSPVSLSRASSTSTCPPSPALSSFSSSSHSPSFPILSHFYPTQVSVWREPWMRTHYRMCTSVRRCARLGSRLAPVLRHDSATASSTKAAEHRCDVGAPRPCAAKVVWRCDAEVVIGVLLVDAGVCASPV